VLAGIHIPFVGENEQAANHGALVHATQAAPPPTLLTAIRESERAPEAAAAATRSEAEQQQQQQEAASEGDDVEISWRRGNERSWPPLIGPFVLFYLAGYRYTHTEHKHKNDMQWYTHSNTAIVIDGKISISLSILLDWHKVSCERCLFLGTQGAIGSHARHEGLLWRWRDTRAGSGRL